MSLDPKIVKKTQDTLGKIIKKPPLTDKLLAKPPFRFLHDIMTSVIKTTGFMKGLFTDGEMNSENVKDRDSKVAFLQKAVDMVAIASKKSLSVKPNKIVAGHEPEKTNEFLQVLASAISANPDNNAIVDKVLNNAGDTAEEPKKEKSKDDKKDDRKRESRDKEERKSKDERKEKEDKREKEKGDRERDRDGKRDKSRDREREEKRGDRHRDKEDRHQEKEDRNKDKEDRHKDREERHKDRERRRKQPVTKSVDTIAEYLAADDSGDTSYSSTDLAECFAKAAKKSSGKLGPKGSNVDAGPNASKLSRPRAARSRPDRKDDVKVEEKVVDDSNVPEKKSEPMEEEATTNKENNKVKKRKSGTKSRMAMRKSDDDNTSNTPSPQKASKIPVKLDKDGKKSSPKIRKRRSSIDKESLNTSQQHVGYPKGKTLRRKSSEQVDLKDEKRSQNGDKKTDVIHVKPVQKEEEAGKENEPALMNGETEAEQPQRVARPTSAKGSRRRREGRHHASSDEEDEPRREMEASIEPSVGDGDLPPQVAASRKIGRPSSARPAPPRRKEQTMVENEPAMRLGSGKPSNVIVDDGKNSDEEEDETFVVEETAPPPPDSDQILSRPPEDGEDEDHGGLVKKILETKKDFEGPQQTKKTEIERSGMTDAQRRKQREHVQKEVDKLRSSIQTLTRSANPLGKIMDYVQEDLDSMQKELERWKTENKQHQMDLKREKGVTDKAVEPLKAQLAEVDQAIKDQLDLIAATKSNISKNDQKTEKMLQSITRS